MNGESSESDISESWSLIDISPSKESVSVTDLKTKLDEKYSLDLKDVSLRKSDSTESEEGFIDQCMEPESDFHKGSCSDFSMEKLGILKKDDSDRGSDLERNDSGDSESIEILDMDANHIDSDSEDLSISMIDSQELKHCEYQSDDEESLIENLDNTIMNTCSTVIKRKRNLVRYSESSDNFVNSHILYNGDFNSEGHSSDDRRLEVHSGALSRLPVYKHYRNNVLNTVLSLSVGVVFAGVACIAIGHFLGVHDTAETAVDLVHALKKLQMENVALQSRLSQLNRVLHKQDSKIDFPRKKLHDTVSCEEKTTYGPARTKTTNINDAALFEIRSSLKSIQLLRKLEDMINEEGENKDQAVGFDDAGKYIHEQLNLLNNKKVEGFKRLEDSDKKISKVVQKIIERLSASQESMEKLYNRLIRLRDNMNDKLARFFPDKSPNTAFLMGRDVNCMQWCPTVNSHGKRSPKSKDVLEFFQPEELYKTKNDSTLMKEREVITKDNNSSISNNNNNYSNNKNNEDSKNNKDKRKVNKGRKKRKKREKNCIKEKPKVTGKKLQKKMKPTGEVPEKFSRKKLNKNEPEEVINIFGRFNDTRESFKKISKEKREKSKEKMKKVRKPKKVKTVLSKRNLFKRNKYGQICTGNECYNLTGHWVFKYANGREEFRRHHTLADWQFERAKGRKEQRDEDDVESWQLKRALARENVRNDPRWRPERYRKDYNSDDDFFHGDFSWI